ncbi:MAG TPA: polysaccharide biosynthesis/export family protein [Candidatus Sulfotelmatobacter sp.]
MKPCSPGWHCRTQAFWTVLAVVLAVPGVAAAQQPAQENPNEATPIAPAAQPVPQAAVNASSESQNSGVKKDNAAQTGSDQSVRLGPGDLLEVNVYNVPELSSKVRVSNAGDIYLPLIDYVHIDGLTQEEAQAVIEKRLSDGGFVRSPHVTLFVDDAASQGVTILGEVSKPGIYPDTADRKLYEMISQAGGFTPSASKKISIIRRNQSEPIHVELPRNLADDTSKNVDVLPGDTITIPRAPIIYVVGDVGRPSGLLVDNGELTVLQALALAGGTNKTAKVGDARIIRKGPTGMTETKIQIKKMLEAKAPDVTLQANDILFVPISGARVLAGRTFDAAMSAATAVTIYAVHP